MRRSTIAFLGLAATLLGCEAATRGAGPSGSTDPALARGRPGPNETCAIDQVGTEYYNRLTTLCNATAAPTTLFLSRNFAAKDRSGLIGQLNRASTKCFVDSDAPGAIIKLTEYRDKVLSLRNDGKISEPFGVDLAGDANGLIADLSAGALVCPSGDRAL